MQLPESPMEVFTPRQQQVLRALRRLPIPPPPPLAPDFLKGAPLGYRLLSHRALLFAGFVFLTLFSAPLLTLPENWSGTVLLKSGVPIELEPGKTAAFALPRSQGTVILQGPARLTADHLGRNLFSAQVEGTLRLDYGDLFLKAHAGIPKQIFVETPLLHVRVTGTQLLVGHRPDQGSRVRVIEGSVFVHRVGDPARWRKLSADMELAATPQGLLFRNPIHGASRESGTPFSPEDEPVISLGRTLWHEEK